MTKDELISAIADLPGDTEVIFHDQSDSARFTFMDIDVTVEELMLFRINGVSLLNGATYWERPNDVNWRNLEKSQVEPLTEKPVKVIVIS